MGGLQCTEDRRIPEISLTRMPAAAAASAARGARRIIGLGLGFCDSQALPGVTVLFLVCWIVHPWLVFNAASQSLCVIFLARAQSISAGTLRACKKLSGPGQS